MAAVKLKENMDFDMEATYQHVRSSLPSYARPYFIRIQVMNLAFNLWSKQSPTAFQTQSYGCFFLAFGRTLWW